MKGLGHIAAMYSSGPFNMQNLPRAPIEAVEFNFRIIEARCAAFYGYDPRNYFGRHVARTQL